MRTEALGLTTEDWRLWIAFYPPETPKINWKGKPRYKKTVKKGDIVPFRRTPPPKRVKRGHLLSEKERKSRQMRFRDKTAYV